jgi:hypothetical protein
MFFDPVQGAPPVAKYQYPNTTIDCPASSHSRNGFMLTAAQSPSSTRFQKSQANHVFCRESKYVTIARNPAGIEP